MMHVRNVRMTMAAAALAMVAFASGGGAVGAQQSSLRAERTVDFRMGKAADVGATVGPVKVSSVELSNLGRGYGRGGFRMKPGGSASEVSTTLRAHFLAENPQSDEWEVTFTLEYLDKAGKVIERQTKRASWEGEAKPFDFDTEILDYVVPMISEVRIKMEGRLD